MNLRRAFAVSAGKSAGALSRLAGRGGGTALPGLIAERVAPNLIGALAAQLPEGAIYVSATNGKTTTTSMLAAILRRSDKHPLHNRTGSNMARGIATTLLSGASAFGDLRRGSGMIGLFEVDEGALPAVVRAAPPRVLVLGNLFRDQLDRYGEVDLIADHWREMVSTLHGHTTLVYNVDDPLVTAIVERYSGPKVGYGIADASAGSRALEHAADSRWCGRCGAEFSYAASFYGHLGHYHCPNCGWQRPQPEVSVERFTSQGMAGNTVTIALGSTRLSFQLPLPGLYNLYNALAAAAAAHMLDIAPDVIGGALSDFGAAFGRVEHVQAGENALWLFLVKNPVGFNQVLRTLFETRAPRRVMLLLNDNEADGRDVSWIWDVDIEPYAACLEHVTVGGIRARDMALRIKYASVDLDRLTVVEDLDSCLTQAMSGLAEGESLYILPTYTAMLAIREVLTKRGWVSPFWS